jgi:hemerythrin-like domain-containing protein
MSAQTTHERPAIEEMAAVHRVFRREFRMLPRLVRAVPAGDKARAKVVVEHARLVLAGLETHHTGEEELLWPLLLERASPACDLVERTNTQHANIDRLTRRVITQLDRWAVIARHGEELAQTLEELRTVLVEHFNLEEAQVVPLAEQHLTADEWNARTRRAIDRMSRHEISLLIGAVLEEADAKERAIIMNGLPTRLRVVMTTVGAVHYRRYISRVRQGLPD